MGATHGNGAPGTPDPGAHVVVPDDASALEPDRLAWLAEQRRRRRRARMRRLVFTRRWDRFGLSGPLVVICLVLTGCVGALAVVFAPRPSSPFPTAEPLAAAPALEVPVGRTTSAPDVAGRLLPQVPLAPDVAPTGGRVLDVRDLRPALLLLVPADCSCAPAVKALYKQAREFQLTTWYLAPGGSADARVALARLDAEASSGGARWAVDEQDAVSLTVGASGLTAVLVRGDGVVVAVLRDLPTTAEGVPALEIDLARLAHRAR